MIARGRFFSALWITRFFCYPGSGFAAEVPKLTLTAKVTVDQGGNEGRIEGEITMDRVLPAGVRRCVYLPYNDPKFDLDPIRNADLVPRKYADLKARPGAMSIRAAGGSVLKRINDYVYEILGTGPTTLQFKTRIPRWLDASRDEWMFTDFYPQDLAECPDEHADAVHMAVLPTSDIKVSLASPPGWTLVSAADSESDAHEDKVSDSLHFTGRKLVFALVRGYSSKHEDIEGIPVDWVGVEPDLSHYHDTLAGSLRVYKDLFGPFPFPKLVVLATSDLQKSSLPGVITLNRPRQEGFAHLQDDASNWTEWQLTLFAAEQWYGAAIGTRNFDDLWLLRGIMDFALLEALREHPRGLQLLKYAHDMPDEEFRDKLNLDFRQVQDLLAALLTYMQPYHALTDESFHTKSPFDQQYGMNYIRAALGLRQMNASLGRVDMRRALRQFTVATRGRFLEPASFARYFTVETDQLNPGQRQNTLDGLRVWWTKDEWPDFSLGDIRETKIAKNRYRVEVEVGQRPGYELPVTVQMQDTAGKIYVAPAVKEADGRWVARFDSIQPYDIVEIDPSREVFDWNRFNNKSTFSRFHFIPGGLTTYDDDAYSVLWLPLASKLPGESLTWMLVAQGAKYIHANYSVIASYVPETKRVGYSLGYLTNLPKLGAYTSWEIIQDRGRTYDGERVVQGSINATLGLWKNPVVGYGFRVRNRETLGDATTRHQTMAVNVSFSPLRSLGACRYGNSNEWEQVVHAEAAARSYRRLSSSLEGSCNIIDGVDVGVRGFVGALKAEDGVSDRVRFNPQNGGEARIRIDAPVLDKVDKISTIGVDVLAPAPLPLPSWMMTVNRQTRVRGFYDYGESWDPHVHYKDAGVGLWLPFGGDVVGKGSVQFINFSLSAVLYREAGDLRSRAPGFVFDFGFANK